MGGQVEVLQYDSRKLTDIVNGCAHHVHLPSLLWTKCSADPFVAGRYGALLMYFVEVMQEVLLKSSEYLRIWIYLRVMSGKCIDCCTVISRNDPLIASIYTYVK